MTFVRRRIDAVITLGVGKFGETKGGTLRLTGLRMSCHMQSYGRDAMGQLQMKIFGLPLSVMNQLTTIGPIATQIRGQNRLLVAAGDEGDALATFFDGTIDTAWSEMSAAPDAVFNITGFAGLTDALKPVPVSSFKGSVDASTIMAGFAKDMGLTFENNGVTVQLSNPYFPGTKLEQVRLCAKAGRFNYSIDCGALAIWGQSGARKVPVPLVSPQTGMIGYPTFTGSGLLLTTIFTPTAKQGGKVKVQSDLTPACGEWNIFNVSHDVESETPGGQWFTRIECGKVPE